MHKLKLAGERIRAFFPGKKAAKKPAGEPAWTQNQTICACNLHAAMRASGQKKNRRPAEKQTCLFFGLSGGFSLCARAQQGQLRWPARKRWTSLLFQLAIAAFTTLKTGFLLLF